MLPHCVLITVTGGVTEYTAGVAKSVGDHRTAALHECRTVRHRRPPGRRPAKDVHDCQAAGCVAIECPPHQCKPMASSTIRQIHWILSAALAAAVRWDWIKSNPADAAKKPRQPTPQPEPPTAAEAARITEAAWAPGPDWGALVWLVMVTGMRRAEVLALRWAHVDLAAGMVSVRRNYVRSGGRAIEKETKTHQMRRISRKDTATVEVLTELRQRYEEMARQLRIESSDDAYLFSHEPAHERPYDPSAVTHRYSKMCRQLGLDSHLHALCHYSATELLVRPPYRRRPSRPRWRRRNHASCLRRVGRRVRPSPKSWVAGSSDRHDLQFRSRGREGQLAGHSRAVHLALLADRC